MKFTKHAVDRYMQFHLLDDQAPDWRDVKALLEDSSVSAVKLKDKTKGGQTQWFIESLGVQVITRHDDGEDVAVTILPPVQFRGLTPLQAQAKADTVAELKFREEMLRSERADLVAVAYKQGSPNGPQLTRLCELKAEISLVCHEREIMNSAFSTMKKQLKVHALEERVDLLSEALRVTLKCIRSNWSAEDTMKKMWEVFPGLVTNGFIDGAVINSGVVPSPDVNTTTSTDTAVPSPEGE